ncbi:hypothetical protein [Longispora albida]|uniref:hypothetical protein n=1 Tax=Longispora albida TaxID=203523 RepID=UPI00036E8AEF|nr:hypothetical protein [Longispora albida]
MGAIVTPDLAADAPELNLPWIITFTPMDEEEVWEPVVCGPYSREHALGLANAVVTSEELVAVVEPLQPLTGVDAILSEITQSKDAAEAYDFDDESEEDEEEEHEHGDDCYHGEILPAPSTVPTEAELKAGFAAIAGKLSS